MKHLRCLLVLTIFSLSLISPGPIGAMAQPETPEDVISRYAAYTPASEAENLAGMAIEEINASSDGVEIRMQFTNSDVSTVEQNAKAAMSRISFLWDSASPNEIICSWAIMTKYSNSVNAPASKTFNPILYASGSTLPNDGYALLYFQGITTEEWPGMETPPLFFVLQFNGKDSKILAGPLLGETLVDDWRGRHPDVTDIP